MATTVEELGIVAGSAHPVLAREVAALLGVRPVPVEVERFPDGELSVAVGPVRGSDVYVVQPTGPPVNEHLLELLLLLDATRRAGAARVTAVVPYFGYARQDRTSRPGEPLGLRVAAEALAASGASRLVVVDPHPRSFESACPVPVEVVSAVGQLVDALGELGPGRHVVVAPDLGAVRLAERMAAALGAPTAAVAKRRVSGTQVHAEHLLGEVRGKTAVIVDDMVATAGTIEAAARLVRARGARPNPVVVATHGLFTGPAAARLGALAPERLVVTDTLAPPPSGPSAEVRSVAPLLAEAIGRLHGGGTA